MPISRRNNLYLKFKNLFKSFPVISTKGFTLIELLIVVAITGILSTIILANYNSFGSRQEVRDTADGFKSELRKYQNFAISGHKNPDQSGDCGTSGTLEAYTVDINNVGGFYDVTLVCPGDNDIGLPRVTFPAGISVSSTCPQIKFLPLNGGTQVCGGANTSVDISFTRDGTTYIVTVNESGEIRLHQ